MTYTFRCLHARVIAALTAVLVIASGCAHTASGVNGVISVVAEAHNGLARSIRVQIPTALVPNGTLPQFMVQDPELNSTTYWDASPAPGSPNMYSFILSPEAAQYLPRVGDNIAVFLVDPNRRKQYPVGMHVVTSDGSIVNPDFSSWSDTDTAPSEPVGWTEEVTGKSDDYSITPLDRNIGVAVSSRSDNSHLVSAEISQKVRSGVSVLRARIKPLQPCRPGGTTGSVQFSGLEVRDHLGYGAAFCISQTDRVVIHETDGGRTVVAEVPGKIGEWQTADFNLNLLRPYVRLTPDTDGTVTVSVFSRSRSENRRNAASSILVASVRPL